MWIVFLTLGLILILVLVLLFIFFLPHAPNTTSTEGIFLSPCGNLGTFQCQSSLTCDGGYCKQTGGGLCTDFSDCQTGYFCSGICVKNGSPTGGLNQFCPCDPGYTCVDAGSESGEFPVGTQLCKAEAGNDCTKNSDCVSQWCTQLDGNSCTGTEPCLCQPGFPPGIECNSNPECAQNNCSNGFCQATGVVTGTVGAVCDVNGVEPNLTPLCNAGLTCVNNICQAPGTGLLSPCSTTIFCPDPMFCPIDPDVQIGSCIFHPDDTPDIGCIEGMTNAVTPGQPGCYNANLITCSADADCASAACFQSPQLNFYSFGVNDTITNNFAQSPAVQLQSFLNAGQIGDGSPLMITKMFTTPSAVPSAPTGTDTIYFMDSIQGLFAIVIDTTNQSVISTWSNILPINNGGVGNLVDAAVSSGEDIYVVMELAGVFTIYSYNSGIFSDPVVPQDGSMNPISVKYLSLNSSGDFLLATPSGAIYTAPAAPSIPSVYTVLAGILYTSGVPIFYTNTTFPSYTTVLYINNNIVTSSVESIPPSIILEANNFNVLNTANGIAGLRGIFISSDVTVMQNSNIAFLPGRISSGTFGLITVNGFYLLGASSCV